MRISLEGIKNSETWIGCGYKLPEFDIERVRSNTRVNPKWLHFGAGNIFRAYTAVLQQHLLNQGKTDTGIILCEAFDEEILDEVYTPSDNLSIAVTLKASGEIGKEVVASVTESIKPSEDYSRLVEVFTNPSLQMVTFTITEKGYALVDSSGAFFPWIKADIDNFSETQISIIGILTKLLYERYSNDSQPIAIVSLDNCSHNGTLLKEAVMAFAKAWIENGSIDRKFIEYLDDDSVVAFTWSMIDKITPRPAPEVEEILKNDGVENIKTVITAKNSFVATFVNAEESQYLAIEDKFPNGRPPLDEVGVMFSDRETIDKIERMKVCTCLNPLHTVLAIFGCLFGYDSISEEMKDSDLVKFIEKIGYAEGLPVVVNPGIIKAEDFIKEVLEVRFPNPFVPDTPQRIATDTSKKIPVRFGETLKAYIAKQGDDLSFLNYIPLFFAGWLRYLMGIDDMGESFELSSDPNMVELKKYVEGIKLESGRESLKQLKHLLSDSNIFGVDLYKHNLGEKVEDMFVQMCGGVGAVRLTLIEMLDRVES